MGTKPHLSQIQSTDILKHPHLFSEVLSILDEIRDLVSKGFKGIFDTYADMEARASEEGFYKVVTDETFKEYSTGYYYNGTDFQINYGLDLILDELDDRLVGIEERVEGSEELIELIKVDIISIKESIEVNEEDISSLGEVLQDLEGSLDLLINELTEILGDWRNDEEYKEKLTGSIRHITEVIGVKGLRRTIVFYMDSFFNEEKSIGLYVPYKGEIDKLYVSIPEAITEDLIMKLNIDGVVEDITLPTGDEFVEVDMDGYIENSKCIFTVISGGELKGINASLDFIQTS